MEHSIFARLFSFLLLFFFFTSILARYKAPADSIHDALGSVSNSMKCRSHHYHKRQAYAAAREACMLRSEGRILKGKCPRNKPCEQYPKLFKTPSKINFALKGPYHVFPLRTMGRLYDGGIPDTDDRLLIDKHCNVAGGYTRTRLGYMEPCLLDVNPPKLNYW